MDAHIYTYVYIYTQKEQVRNRGNPYFTVAFLFVWSVRLQYLLSRGTLDPLWPHLPFWGPKVDPKETIGILENGPSNSSQGSGSKATGLPLEDLERRRSQGLLLFVVLFKLIWVEDKRYGTIHRTKSDVLTCHQGSSQSKKKWWEQDTVSITAERRFFASSKFGAVQSRSVFTIGTRGFRQRPDFS